MATGNDLCSVRAVSVYATRRGAAPGGFFCAEGGAPLTKARFVELVRAALTCARVPIAEYSGHSFRIGAATVAAKAGIPDSTIQALGKWLVEPRIPGLHPHSQGTAGPELMISH